MFILRVTGLAFLMAAGLAMVAADVSEARIGRGKSFGSRGERTYNAPPSTNTAPNAAPIDRSYWWWKRIEPIFVTPRTLSAAPRQMCFGSWKRNAGKVPGACSNADPPARSASASLA